MSKSHEQSKQCRGRMIWVSPERDRSSRQTTATLFIIVDILQVVLSRGRPFGCFSQKRLTSVRVGHIFNQTHTVCISTHPDPVYDIIAIYDRPSGFAADCSPLFPSVEVVCAPVALSVPLVTVLPAPLTVFPRPSLAPPTILPRPLPTPPTAPPTVSVTPPTVLPAAWPTPLRTPDGTVSEEQEWERKGKYRASVPCCQT